MNEKLHWPAWPQYTQEHEDAVLRVIRSNQLFAAKEVASFEAEFSAFVGSNYAVGVGNATQGLHLALAAHGIGTGDEVIVTPYSWISSASCVLMQNAIPVFVDIESKTFGLDPEKIEEAITPRTRAVILVHMFGLASRVEEVKRICDYHGIILIEDASHAHGARLKNQHLGTFGKVGVFSLHQRKAISTGDGGVLITDEPSVYENMRRMRSFGADRLSYNYRMTEFSAALGRVGLRKLEEQNATRRRNHQTLSECLKGSPIRVVEPADDVHAVFYSNLLDIDMPLERQELFLERVVASGVPLKRTWQPLHKHPHFKRENMPNGIAPWDCISSIYVDPDKLVLPISDLYQTHRIFELDCHPLVSQNILSASTKRILEISCDVA
jgi:perosamine synthetase